MFLAIIIMVFLIMPFFTFAQSDEINTELAVDEIVNADDLDVGEPSVLPGSFFYGIKDMWRNVHMALTFGDVKKAELKLQHVNERLLEVQKLIAEGGDDQSSKLNKAIEKYEIDLVKIQEITSKIEGKTENNPKLDEFINKLADSEIKRYKIMQRIQESAPEQSLETIIKAKEDGVKNFGQIVKQVVQEKNVVKKMENILNQQKGSELKDLKQMQIIRELGENLPEEIKDEFKEVEVNLRHRFENQAQDVDAERVKSYFDKMQGDETKQLEIMTELKNSNKLNAEMKQKINFSENQVRIKLQDKIKNIEDVKIREKVINDINPKFKKYNPNLINSLNQIHEKKIEASSVIDAKPVYETKTDTSSVTDVEGLADPIGIEKPLKEIEISYPQPETISEQVKNRQQIRLKAK